MRYIKVVISNDSCEYSKEIYVDFLKEKSDAEVNKYAKQTFYEHIHYELLVDDCAGYTYRWEKITEEDFINEK